MIELGHGVDVDDPLPFRGWLARCMAAPDRTSSKARADPTSRVQAVGSTMSRHLKLISSNDAATHAERARTFRRFGDRLSTLPSELRSGSFDPDVL